MEVWWNDGAGGWDDRLLELGLCFVCDVSSWLDPAPTNRHQPPHTSFVLMHVPLLWDRLPWTRRLT